MPLTGFVPRIKSLAYIPDKSETQTKVQIQMPLTGFEPATPRLEVSCSIQAELQGLNFP